DPQGAHLAAAQVAEEEDAVERRQTRIVQGHAADHRAEIRAVVVLEDWPDGIGARRRRVERCRALEAGPAEVQPALAGRDQVDLLLPALPDVADEELARRRVDPEAPGVPEAACPDLAARALDVHAGIRDGSRVVLTVIGLLP